MHSKAIPMSELAKRVQTFSEGCYDDFAETKPMAFEAPYNLRYNSPVEGFGAGVVTEAQGALNQHAFGQLQERLQGPGVRWLTDGEKCPDPVRADVMNSLLRHRENTRLMLRRRDGTVRAVLSDQYSRFDHKDFMPLLEEAIGALPAEVSRTVEVHRTEVDDVLRAYILLPAITFAQDPPGKVISGGSDLAPTQPFDPGTNGGGLHPALWIHNSEIGTGGVRLHGAVYRMVCSNGIIWGWKAGETFNVIHRHLSTETMRAVLADALPVALRMSETAAEAFLASQRVIIRRDKANNLIESWADKYGLTIEGKDAWKSMVKVEAMTYGRTDAPALFDVVNGLTFIAQDRKPDEREQMERAAGDLLVEDLFAMHYAERPAALEPAELEA
jgi:hypothetical protein